MSPSGPYLLGHGSLHHPCRVGLQAVIVVPIRVQLQKGPPGEGGEGTPGRHRDRYKAGTQLSTQPFPGSNPSEATVTNRPPRDVCPSVCVHMSG